MLFAIRDARLARAPDHRHPPSALGRRQTLNTRASRPPSPRSQAMLQVRWSLNATSDSKRKSLAGR